MLCSYNYLVLNLSRNLLFIKDHVNRKYFVSIVKFNFSIIFFYSFFYTLIPKAMLLRIGFHRHKISICYRNLTIKGISNTDIDNTFLIMNSNIHNSFFYFFNGIRYVVQQISKNFCQVETLNI